MARLTGLNQVVWPELIQSTQDLGHSWADILADFAEHKTRIGLHWDQAF